MTASPRRFQLVRHADVTGISGTGVVAEGVQFTDGTVVVRWLKTGTTRPEHVKPTTVVHDDIASVIGLHGHGGATVVEWLDTDTTNRKGTPPMNELYKVLQKLDGQQVGEHLYVEVNRSSTDPSRFNIAKVDDRDNEAVAAWNLDGSLA